MIEKIEEIEEKITCSAIWYKELDMPTFGPANIKSGVVVCGHRHHDCISTLQSLTGKRTSVSDVGKFEQGFLTNKNRFVDRTEGGIIAMSTNQIKKLQFHQTQLFSEDLY